MLSFYIAGDDTMLTKTWNTIGDHYYDRQQWLARVSTSQVIIAGLPLHM